MGAERGGRRVAARQMPGKSEAAPLPHSVQQRLWHGPVLVTLVPCADSRKLRLSAGVRVCVCSAVWALPAWLVARGARLGMRQTGLRSPASRRRAVVPAAEAR